MQQCGFIAQNKHCWLKGVQIIAGKCEVGNIFQQPDFLDINYVEEKLKEKYRELWSKRMYDDNRGKGGNKLRTYREFKHTFEFEQYLNNIHITEHR